MNEILRKVKITDDLIMKIARDQFSTYNNEEILDEKREYIIGDWCNRSYDMLNNFNELIDISKKLTSDVTPIMLGVGGMTPKNI